MGSDPIIASVTGLAHRRAGRPGQDAVAERRAGALLALAVADGVGSKPLSGQGARAAVEAAVTHAGDHAGDGASIELARACVTVADAAVRIAAHDSGVAAGELATTLSVALVDDERVVVAAVGDGVHVLRGADGTLELVAAAPAAEFAGQTDALPGHAHVQTAERRRDRVDGVLLSTDGLEGVLCHGRCDRRRPFGGFVHGILDAAWLLGWGSEHFARMLAADSFGARCRDDLTLAFALLTPEFDHGIPLALAGGGIVHARGALRWPSGGMAWDVAEGGGLAVVPVPAAPLPSAPAGAELAWPIDSVLGPGGAFGVLVRPWRTPLADPRRHGSAIRQCVHALHDAGFAHGRLERSSFAAGPHDAVQLVDVIPALAPGDADERRLADERFLATLAPPPARRRRRLWARG